MNNQIIANALEDVAKIKKALGANQFSIGAYKKAAIFVANLQVPVKDIDFENTKGIGPKIAENIKEFLSTGKIQFIEDNLTHLQSDQKIEELLRVEGIGEKTALQIYQKLNISTIDQLKKSLEDGTLSTVFKEKSIEKIKRGLEYLETTKGRIRLDQAIEIALKIYNYMKPFVDRIEFCGSFRRSKETVGDIDFAIIAKDNGDVLTVFENMPGIDKVIDSGDKKTSVWMGGVRIDCYLFTKDIFESGILHLTGSDEHNKQMRIYAIAKGWILSQYGLYKRDEEDKRTGDRLDDGTEKDIYRLLGFEWIPPEHREGNIEFEAYRLGQTVKIVEAADITSDYHIHSTWSDGKSSIRENIEFAISKGLKTIAICDHSQSLKIAGGLSIERLKEKIQEIKLLRPLYPQINILAGSEVDITSDGVLDYPYEILDELDIVIAAIHSSVKKDVTEIYKNAIRSGKVDIIAHITGRLINNRPGHEMDVEEVLKECVKHNVAVELNCQPCRLDANEFILKSCKRLGVKVSFGSDAHEKNQISFVKSFGVWIARRAWLTKENIYGQ
jgi:DNA polymerase (family 10)